MTHTLAVRLPAGHYPPTAAMFGFEDLPAWQAKEIGRLLTADYRAHLDQFLNPDWSASLLGNGEIIADVEYAGDVALWWAEYGQEEMSTWEPAYDVWDSIDNLIDE